MDISARPVWAALVARRDRCLYLLESRVGPVETFNLRNLEGSVFKFPAEHVAIVQHVAEDLARQCTTSDGIGRVVQSGDLAVSRYAQRELGQTRRECRTQRTGRR